jgi:hypothetical protein
MFDLEKNVLIQSGKESPIVKWSVWFATPKGLMGNLVAAIQFCKENDWDFHEVVKPVPVAIDELGRYEVIITFRK